MEQRRNERAGKTEKICQPAASSGRVLNLVRLEGRGEMNEVAGRACDVIADVGTTSPFPCPRRHMTLLLPPKEIVPPVHASRARDSNRNGPAHPMLDSPANRGAGFNPADQSNGSLLVGVAVRLLASLIRKPGSIPGGVATGFSHVVIAPDDAASQRIFSGISRPCFPVANHTHLISPSSALNTSPLREAQTFPPPLTGNSKWGLSGSVNRAIPIGALVSQRIEKNLWDRSRFNHRVLNPRKRRRIQQMFNQSFLRLARTGPATISPYKRSMPHPPMGAPSHAAHFNNDPRSKAQDRSVFLLPFRRRLADLAVKSHPNLFTLRPDWPHKTLGTGLVFDWLLHTVEVFRLAEMPAGDVGMQGRWKREIHIKKLLRLAASSGTIPTSENPGATPVHLDGKGCSRQTEMDQVFPQLQPLPERYLAAVRLNALSKVSARSPSDAHRITRNHYVFGGQVVDYWWRVEFQCRGSPRLHMVLWVKDRPNFETQEGIQMIERVCFSQPSHLLHKATRYEGKSLGLIGLQSTGVRDPIKPTTSTWAFGQQCFLFCRDTVSTHVTWRTDWCVYGPVLMQVMVVYVHDVDLVSVVSQSVFAPYIRALLLVSWSGAL
ncbi:hypothetical protein PR048_022152 [Dryococelus australis]|uniref:Uncharacterized protein n=1 Tax=Dryococelus australis TaxID=614101 RepID=A0ABQ9H089_9NEOP|nr:hypothetical protein PR048_022152 [Dryococelus australis]